MWQHGASLYWLLGCPPLWTLDCLSHTYLDATAGWTDKHLSSAITDSHLSGLVCTHASFLQDGPGIEVWVPEVGPRSDSLEKAKQGLL